MLERKALSGESIEIFQIHVLGGFAHLLRINILEELITSFVLLDIFLMI